MNKNKNTHNNKQITVGIKGNCII